MMPVTGVILAGGKSRRMGQDKAFLPFGTGMLIERVIEVRYDHMEGERFRHTAQFERWRPDRDPRSCTFEQLEEPITYDLAEILGSKRRG